MYHCSKKLNRRNLKHIFSQLFQIQSATTSKSNNSKLNAFSLEWNIQMSISCFVKIKLEPVDVGSGPFNVSPQVYQLGHCRACYESSTK